jgi:EAL domain-containing protein (putative c-di-GMP-specific phosphodiesterase class I)
MLEAQSPGAIRIVEDPTVAMQRLIDQAMDLLPDKGDLTAEDKAALTRLTGFVSTVAGAMWDLSLAPAGEAMSDRVNEFIAGVFRTGASSVVSGAAPRRAETPASVQHSSAPADHDRGADYARAGDGVTADAAVRQSVEGILAGSRFAIRCQPIVSLDSGEVVGAEALTRFPGTHRPADAWFGDAERVGLGKDLQLATVQQAVSLAGQLPPGAFLTFNVGPEVLGTPELLDLLDAVEAERIVIELTEHVRVDDYDRLLDSLAEVRERGARLAVDDTGAGFSSLGHILHLRPEIVKLDCQFTRGIDTDAARRSLAHALMSFANDIGAEVVSEGIETAAELDTVRGLGVPYGQGYFLGRPTRPELIPDCFAHVAARARMSPC